MVGEGLMRPMESERKAMSRALRLRVKKASDELAKVFEDLAEKTAELERTGQTQSPFAEITDDDIDNLFK